MPIVFVHGVRTRDDDGYRRSKEVRLAFFRRHLLDGISAHPASVQVMEPYWGGDAATFAWDLACVPTGKEDIESLGIDDDDEVILTMGAALAEVVPTATPQSRLLLTVARDRGLGAAVDLAVAATAAGTDGDDADLADLGARAGRYVEANPAPSWLAEVQDDGAFLTRLGTEIANAGITPETATDAGDWQTLGVVSDVLDRIREGVDRVKRVAIPLVADPVYNALRRLVAPTVATFVGDVFAYQSHRGTVAEPGPIPSIVLADLDRAAALRSADDPLIVVAHSMGGVIAYDLLTAFRPDLSVDALVTVGSQVGLFAEMGLYLSSPPVAPGPAGTLPRPTGVDVWINVLDYSDVLSFRVEPIVAGVTEFAYATGALLTAHGAYFAQPGLYERLRLRLREAGVGR